MDSGIRLGFVQPRIITVSHDSGLQILIFEIAW